jgi:predicted nucleotidyltransferase
MWGSLAFGDLNSDNYTDLLLVGCNRSAATSCGDCISKIYINNGTSLEENSTWQSSLTRANRASIAFGDIDNDGDLDLALVGCSSGGGNSVCNNYLAKIYINNGTALDENSTWQSNLTAVFFGSLALGDIDNDGDLDLALSGGDSSAKKTTIYLNNGTSLLESLIWGSNLSNVYRSSIALGDINNDNSLDLALTGWDGGYHAEIYINNGSSLEENSIWQQNLLAVDESSHAFGDYDNDGDLDFTLIGHFTTDRHRIYRNNGTTFIQIQKELTDLAGIFDGSLAFGDYDNDGYLDLISSGHEAFTTLYTYNTSRTNFTTYSQDLESHVIDLEHGTIVVWQDLDNDYDLDLIISGATAALGRQAKVYISNRSETQANNLPQPPTGGFSANYSSGSVSFGWHNGSDVETNISGLYYNLRVGTASNKNAIVTGIYGGSSNPTAGYFGNMMQRKNITITREWDADTIYYWSVQTIDTGLAKSNWSAEQSFTTPTDTGLPNITLIAPDNNYYSDNISVLFNATVVDDSGIANVSIWADFDGTFKLNETNASGKNDTSYVFIRNLSQGSYSWKYQAYDNSSAFNYVNSSTRIVYVDLYAPIVALISPANESTWTSSSIVTFSYNVTDLAIVNCSLIIDGAVDQTEESIIVNTTQTFSKTLVNGNYNWSVNCTDNVNRRNNSSTYSLTVSYTAPAGNGANGGTGGGGGGAATLVENITNVTEQEPGEIEEPLEEEPDEEKEGIEKIVGEITGLFEKTWIYLVVIGGIVLIVVAYFVYIRKFVRWGRKEKRINWKPKKRWFEL